jgi:hypothetical protein
MIYSDRVGGARFLLTKILYLNRGSSHRFAPHIHKGVSRIAQRSTTRCVSLFEEADSPGIASSLESKLEVLTKSRMAMLFVMVAGSTALFAQNSRPYNRQKYASARDAREIVGASVTATERGWQALGRQARLRLDQGRRPGGAQSFSMGLFVARVERGAHIILEQTCVGDGVPKRLELRATPESLWTEFSLAPIVVLRRTARTL